MSTEKLAHIGAGKLALAVELAASAQYENAVNDFLDSPEGRHILTNPYAGLDVIGGPKPITCKKVKHQYLKTESGEWQCSCGKKL